MSKALREQKCLSRSTAWAGQTRPPVQRRTASASPVLGSISRMAAEPQAGQVSGKRRARRRGGRVFQHGAEDLRNDVAGALHPHRVADPDVLAGDLVLVVQGRVFDHDAADRDGLQALRPASARRCGPTWMSMPSSLVVARSAGNLWATAQRGARDTKPSRACSDRSSTL